MDKVDIRGPGEFHELVANLPDEPEQQREFQDLLATWNVLPGETASKRQLSFHSYKLLRPVGTPFVFSGLAGLNPDRFRIDAVPGQKTAQLYAVEDRIVICPPAAWLEREENIELFIVAPQILASTTEKIIDTTPQPARACKEAETRASLGINQRPAPGATRTITIFSRSVEGMIQYLGAILRAKQPQNPVRFYVRQGNGGNERISLDYKDGVYSVAPYSEDDHTLKILSLLEQLLNLRKNSKEIPTTPAVQSVP